MSGLKGNNFHHMTKTGLALAPQSVTSGNAVGETIVTPWNYGRQITFLIAGGAFAASADLTVLRVQVRDKDSGAWTNAVDKDGSTLNIPGTFDNDGDLEGKMIRATVDFSTIDGNTYDAIRIFATEAGGAAALIGAVYVISDLYSKPSGDSELILSLQ